MKFGQLIEYNMRNIFLEKSYTKCGGETSPRLFSGKLKLSISLDHSLKFFTIYFYCILSLWLSKYIETKLHTTCFYKAYFKNKHILEIKRGLELFSLPHFLHIFKEKYCSCHSLQIDQVSSSSCFYFVRYWAICVLQLFVNQVVTSWLLKLTFSF